MIVVVMGVCGSGKTSVGHRIAERMDWAFIEGDDLHPEANRRKMAAGTPLTDEDRWPWLDRIVEEMRRPTAKAARRWWPARRCAGPIATGCVAAARTFDSCT